MNLREALRWAEKAEDIERGDMAYDDEYQAVLDAARRMADLEAKVADGAEVWVRQPGPHWERVMG